MRKMLRCLPLLFLTFNIDMKIYANRQRDYDIYTVLSQLIGKDAWILVDIPVYYSYSSLSDSLYIRVVDIDDNLVHVNEVSSIYVEQKDVISMLAEWDYFVERTLNNIRTYRINSLNVRTPLEILNTDEIMNILEENCHRRG